MGKAERTKGHNWEREVASRLRSLWPKARRLRQESLYDLSQLPDVEAGPFDIECKVGKAPPFFPAIKQAIREARKGQMPIAAIKPDREGEYVIMEWQTFYDLLCATYNPATREAIHVLEDLKTAIKVAA